MLKQGTVRLHLFDRHKTANFPRLLTFFLNTYSNEIQSPLQQVTYQEMSAEDSGAMVASRIELIQTFVVIAKMEVDSADLRSGLSIIINWIRESEPQLRICANLFIGNLCYSHPKMSDELAHHPHIGDNLAVAFANHQHREALLSAFDLLNNLATDAEKRSSLGKAKVLNALGKCVWQLKADLQTRQRAFYCIRQLLRGSLPNAYEFMKTTSLFHDSTEGKMTMLHDLLVIFGETEESITRVEIGRVIAEAWRTIHLHYPATELQVHAQSPIENLKAGTKFDRSEAQFSPKATALLVRKAFDRHPQIIEPILVLVQSSNPALMTEGWLILAFMSMWKEGAEMVYGALCATDKIGMFGTVVQTPDVQSKDRANARYVVAELQRQFVSHCQSVGAGAKN